MPYHPPLFDPTVRHNIRVETWFSAFYGVFMALALMAAPVLAAEGPQAGAIELTILMTAFPVGVLMGPFWALLGHRVGMRRLVIISGLAANTAMLAVAFANSSWAFTILVTLAQLMLAGMRMGQASLYPVLYDRAIRGRVLGKLTSWTFATMVPSILLAGWLLDFDRSLFRVCYPVAGVCGLIACAFYARLRVPVVVREVNDQPVPRGGYRGVARVLRSDRDYRLYQIAFFLAGSAFFMTWHVVLLLIKDRLSFSPLEASVWMGVVPQLTLAMSSPLWGVVLDRIGFARCRMLITGTLTVYLVCFFAGITTGWVGFIYAGCILFGLTNGGGQVTWVLGPGHYAPTGDEVPTYSGVHFVLNGVRGLGAPWLGSLFLLMIGPWALIAGALTSAAAFPFLLRLRRSELPKRREPPEEKQDAEDRELLAAG